MELLGLLASVLILSIQGVLSIQHDENSYDGLESEYLNLGKTPLLLDNYYEYQDISLNVKQENNCDSYKCFNPLHCEVNTPKQLLYYVYPPLTFIDVDDNLLYSAKSMISQEYREVLQSIIRSSRFTVDPNRACIFVPSIDVAWFDINNSSLLSSILERLPYWRAIDGKPGTNHMIVSLSLRQDLLSLRKVIGHSILVATNHDTWTFRPAFDYSLPAIIEIENQKLESETFATGPNHFNVIFFQYSSINSRQKQSIDKLASLMRKDLHIVISNYSGLVASNNCEALGIEKSSCIVTQNITEVYKSPKLVGSLKYCLILHLDDSHPIFESSHYLFIQSIINDCIPIVSNDLILPYHSKEMGGWDNELALIITNSEILTSISTLISSINSTKYKEMLNYAQYFKRNYLKSWSQVTENLMLNYDYLVYPQIFLPSSKCLINYKVGIKI